MRPAPQATSRIRSRMLHGTVATVAMGILAAGLSHTATPSVAAPVPQPTIGGFDASEMNARDIQLSRDAGTRVLPAQVLAQARSVALTQTAKEVADERAAEALASRTSALDDAATKISEQSKLLTDQSSFLVPTAGEFGSGFGMRLHPILHYYRMHNGQDIGGTCGQPIWAAQDGKVTKVVPEGYNGGSGHNVRIDGGKVGGVHLETAYLHMDKITVKVGQKVHKGELLGTVGNTGISTACHLHFSVYEDGKGVDPLPYLKMAPKKK
ncbi:MAG: M23 family metallopeptidase [Micropruina sp.]|uniref:M23 family metallopeptidase n=1 Tax=Micropruina sp. TaxID=2737536 RepID=UPI0039E5F5BA